MTHEATLSIEITCEECGRARRRDFDIFMVVTIGAAASLYLCVRCWMRPNCDPTTPRVLETEGVTAPEASPPDSGRRNSRSRGAGAKGAAP